MECLNEPLPERIDTFKLINKDQHLVKFILLEILALLLPVSPAQKQNIIKSYFKTQQEIDDLEYRFQQIILHNDFKAIQSDLKTNFSSNSIESYKRNCSFSDSTGLITNKLQNDLKVN